ncbi:MAG TPA: WbuC family cupin fold metalloprotein [Polyangiaceae bacterium]|nr:WbuC family cupin fold metalloprotein [Polyangiaceae bacterium]
MTLSEDYLRALSAPTEELAILDDAALAETVAYSRTSPRKRVIKPFHRSLDEPLHRMLNAVQPGTYVRPHRHVAPPNPESWVLLRGRVVFFTFDDEGRVTHSVELAAQGPRFGVDLVAGVFHTFVTVEADTVLFEVKSGPYSSTEKAFAPWAPAELDEGVPAYLESLMAAHRERSL